MNEKMNSSDLPSLVAIASEKFNFCVGERNEKKMI
jgi:hypothetical protein